MSMQEFIDQAMMGGMDKSMFPLVAVDDDPSKRKKPANGQPGIVGSEGFVLRGFIEVRVVPLSRAAVRFEAPAGSSHRARLDTAHAEVAAAMALKLAEEKKEMDRRRAALSEVQRREEEAKEAAVARMRDEEKKLADLREAARVNSAALVAIRHRVERACCCCNYSKP
jgi:flagellar biosynthesis GTPase FlhF